MGAMDLRKPAGATTSATAMDRWPWAVRALLGCAAACVAVGVTYAIDPLRAFPLLLTFSAVILVSWYLGVWGGAVCALTGAVLADRFLTKPQLRFSIGFAREEIRLAIFLLVSTFLGWAIRRLALQRSQLATQELQQHLTIANAERQLAEQRAQASEALRDREDMLNISLKSNGMGLWVWHVADNAIEWSDEIYRIAGHTPDTLPANTAAWIELAHPDDRDTLRKAVAETRSTGVEYHQQYRLIRPDGSQRWVESQGKAQRDTEGRVVRVVGVLSDITMRKQSEEAMLRAEKLAVAGRLAASVAHEINNPLEAVANLLYLIAHAESVADARAQAHQALDELMRVSLITQQTLKFHRQAGTPKPILLSEVVQTVLALFRGRLRGSRIAAEVRVHREQPVACMPGEVQQIFANLISNAIDAMPRGGRLTISLRPSLDWRDRATPGMRITFCDSGVGMDRATMQRIFEPFFTTKPETGTGLGMWVVAQLADRYHGHVRVWSARRAQSGATAVSIFLPFQNAPAPALETSPHAEASMPSLAVPTSALPT